MWRFIGFVCLVIGGLAVVFYYTGMNEDPGVRSAARQNVRARTISSPLAAGNAPVIQSTGTQPGGPMRIGGSITVTGAEIRPKEEMEATCEIETGEILEVLKQVGDQVKPGDVLVKLNDNKIRFTIKAQEIQAQQVADAKIKSAENAKNVYDKNVIRLGPLVKQGAASAQEYDLEVARLIQATHEIDKAKYEKVFEEHRLDELKQQHELYQLKSRIHGTVVRVLKKRGNTLRQGEPAVYVVNDKNLLAEGAVEAGLTSMLRPGMNVVLEPENDRESVYMFDGHTGAVTSLSPAPQGRFLASSAEDGVVLLWDLQPVRRLPWVRLERPDHRRVGCKSVAVSPAVQNDTYQVVAGYADGALFQWTVKLAPSVKVEWKLLGKDHDQAINAVCFRGDGKYLATGSDDRRVGIWDAAAGKRLYWVHADQTPIGNAHFGAVTSVLFTKDMQHLITSGTDNTLRRWKLGADGSELERTMAGRTGDVGKLNLAGDGRYVFFEHNDELRILDSASFDPKSVVNTRRSGRFVQFASFSNDGRLAVAATDQGRNMLIRMPKFAEAPEVAQGSATTPAGTQVSTSPTPPASTQSTTDLWRQEGAIGAHFTLPEAVKATCAEFLSDGQRTFLLMGSTDNKIRIWEAPNETELNTPILARINFVSSQVESGTGLVRVQAEFENTRHLKTGKRVAMIVYPDAADHAAK